MNKKVYYEQPLNEKIRTLLRLEFLFKQARHFQHGQSVWESRASISILLEIYALFSRSDLKGELLKELERHSFTLNRLKRTPDVDIQRLQMILNELEEIGDELQSGVGQIGAHLKDNEFLAMIRQRSAIPGGTCDFDLPIYHHWLQRLQTERISDMDEWMGGFQPASNAVSALLRLIRHSSSPTQEEAVNGGFQRSLPTNLPVQMVRVAIPPEKSCYPEVSGGRHRFSIRFLRYEGYNERPVQLAESLQFELVVCVI